MDRDVSSRARNTPLSATYEGIELVYLPSIQTKSLSTFSHTALAALDLAFRRADVALFVNVANSPFCLITKLARIPTAINVDGLEWLRPKWGPTGKKYFHTSARLSKHTAHVVVTDAGRMQEIYREEFGVHSVDIAYGADIPETDRSDRVRELGLTPGKYIFSACRLVPDNNVDILVDGYRRIETDLPYVVVGSTPYANPYTTQLQATEHPGLRFLGQVDDQDLMDELYANAAVYLHAHEFGGTNPTLLRAMAAGCAVLALDTPFNREVLGPYGRFFAKRGEAVAEALQPLLEDAKALRTMSEGGPRRIRECYTWDHITDQYEELFRSMLA